MHTRFKNAELLMFGDIPWIEYDMQPKWFIVR